MIKPITDYSPISVASTRNNSKTSVRTVSPESVNRASPVINDETVSVKPLNNGEIFITDVPDYSGEYSVIPTTSSQILSTKNKRVRDDIVIAPIPQNYGLITYNGFSITIS